MAKIAIITFVIFVSFTRAEYDNQSTSQPFDLNTFLDHFNPSMVDTHSCSVDIANFKNAVLTKESWALQMLDASSKIPPGLLTGNIIDFGNFDECLAVREEDFVTQHCIVTSAFSESVELTIGTLTNQLVWSQCLPASCSESDVLNQLLTVLRDDAGGTKVVHCEKARDSTFSLASWCMLVAIFFFAAFILTATFYEYRSIKLRWPVAQAVMASFSLILSWKTFLSEKPSGAMVESIHGIRCLSSLVIIVYHQFLMETWLLIPKLNQFVLPKLLEENLFGMVSLYGFLAVEAFFFISGITLSLSFMRQIKADVPFSFFRYAAHRFFRLTPVYLFIIVMHMTILSDIGSGPLWYITMEASKHECMKNWWVNILYLDNYIQENQCLDHVWYLAVDMQLYLVAPLFLFATIKRRTQGLILIMVVCLASWVYTFFVIYTNDIPWGPGMFEGLSLEKQSLMFAKVYRPTHVRLPSYFLGLLFGYYLDYLSQKQLTVRQGSQTRGWTFAIFSAFLFCFLISLWCKHRPHPFLSAICSIFLRIFLLHVVGWIIFVCERGNGGIISRFLSCRTMELLAKVSYCFYMIQLSFIKYEAGVSRTSEYFTYYSTFRKLVFNIVLSLLSAFILTITMELPMCNLSRLMLKRK